MKNGEEEKEETKIACGHWQSLSKTMPCRKVLLQNLLDLCLLSGTKTYAEMLKERKLGTSVC